MKLLTMERERTVIGSHSAASASVAHDSSSAASTTSAVFPSHLAATALQQSGPELISQLVILGVGI